MIWTHSSLDLAASSRAMGTSMTARPVRKLGQHIIEAFCCVVNTGEVGLSIQRIHLHHSLLKMYLMY